MCRSHEERGDHLLSVYWCGIAADRREDEETGHSESKRIYPQDDHGGLLHSSGSEGYPTADIPSAALREQPESVRKRANTDGSIYEEDIRDLQEQFGRILEAGKGILEALSAVR